MEEEVQRPGEEEGIGWPVAGLEAGIRRREAEEEEEAAVVVSGQIEDLERAGGVKPSTLTVDVPSADYLTRSPSLCLRRGVVASDYIEVYASMVGNYGHHVVEQRSVMVNWIIEGVVVYCRRYYCATL
ncbi:hypothetical protein ZWY2020_051632 [Hordeum vulgare]|nr:hypothetical protein ZWY2020_051632 [Hordeum vulgare]